MTLTLSQTNESPQRDSLVASQLRKGIDSILADEDILFWYTEREVRSLAATAARFGDRPLYPKSEYYMKYYNQRQCIMARQKIPTGIRPTGPGLVWGPEYQTISDEW